MELPVVLPDYRTNGDVKYIPGSVGLDCPTVEH